MRHAFFSEYDTEQLAANKKLVKRLRKVLIHTAGASFPNHRLGSEEHVAVMLGTAHTNYT